jgi:hypothetical protein
MSEANATSDSVGRDLWLWLSPRVLKFRNRYGVNNFVVLKNLEFFNSTGTSKSFMHHPANDRCWPKYEAQVLATSVSFGES